jgi:hypothetical protein
MSSPTPSPFEGQPAWDRASDQQRYYSGKSGLYQKRFKALKFVSLLATACVPAAAAVLSEGQLKLAVTALGVLVAAVEGWLMIAQYPQLWVSYRASSELIKREQSLFLARAGDYDGKDDASALRALAERTETIVSAENNQWVETQRKAIEALAAKAAEAEAELKAARKAEKPEKSAEG